MYKLLASFLVLLLIVLPCTSQQQPSDKLTIPAGSRLSVVLTQQISSSATHSGDQIHVQLVSPVLAGQQVAIPAGTYLLGTVNRTSQQKEFVSLSLYAASLAFANGYVQKLSGPIELRSAEGWWSPAPNSHRGAALIPFFLAPGVGAAIGAATGKNAVLTPPSITGGQLTPGSVTDSTRGRNAMIGFGVGAAVMAVGIAAYLSSRHHGGPDFFFAAGAPMEIRLASEVSLDAAQVSDALHQPQSPVPQAATQCPQAASDPSSASASLGLCPGPDMPGTPAIGDARGTLGIAVPAIPATIGAVLPRT